MDLVPALPTVRDREGKGGLLRRSWNGDQRQG